MPCLRWTTRGSVCCTLRVESLAISCSFAHTALSPIAMHCEAGGRMGHQEIKKQTELQQQDTVLFFLFRSDRNLLSWSLRLREVQLLNVLGLLQYYLEVCTVASLHLMDCLYDLLYVKRNLRFESTAQIQANNLKMVVEYRRMDRICVSAVVHACMPLKCTPSFI